MPKNSLRFTPLLFLLLILCSCNKKVQESINNSNFGESISYDSFLWKQARNDTLNKAFAYNFNNWANESTSYVTLFFQDQNNKPLTIDSPYYFLVNNQIPQNGKLVLESNQKTKDTLNLQLVIKDQSITDLYGYIQIGDHNIDRVNNIENPKQENIYKWTAAHELQMNPLKVLLLWVLAILVATLFFYLLILRPIIYKRMGKGQITIQEPFYKNIKTKNNIEIIFRDKPLKQSWLQKLFQGKKTVVVNPIFTEPIYLTPSSRGKIRIRTAGKYNIDPFTSSLEKGTDSTYELTNNQTNDKINITYL